MRDKYLHRRKGVYYFRMRVPQDCVKQFGTPFIRKSLRTQSRVEARKICNILTLHLGELFIRVQCDMLTDERIHEIVTKIFTQALVGFEDIRIKKPHQTSEIKKFIADFPKDKIKELITQNRTDLIMPIADFILDAENEPIDKNSFQYKKLLRELLKMFAEICSIEQERSNGNFLNEYDKKFSYTATALEGFKKQDHPKPAITLSQLYEKFAHEQKTAGNWMPKTELDYQSYLETLIEIVTDINVNQINTQLMLDYRDQLVKLPPNRKKIKKYRDKSISEIINMKNVKTMSLRTVNCHLSFVSSLLRWGAKRGFLEKNYAEGLTYKRKSKASEERSAYETGDLMRIVNYIATNKGTGHPERFWIPLIAMLSGIRLNEACQLYKEDIVEIDAIWCFDINANDDKKRVKNLGSIRKLPIHPILIQLGFVEYVQGVKSKHIWRNLRYDSKNGYGNLFQKWYQRINRNIITKDKKKVFHSFRHAFTNNLKQQGVSGQLIAGIVGHATGSITMERYGKSYNPQIMLEALEKLDYGFDIVAEIEKCKRP